MEKSVPGGGHRKRRFLRSFFFRLWLILGALEGNLIRYTLPLFHSFSDLGGYFSARVSFLAFLMGFDVFGATF